MAMYANKTTTLAIIAIVTAIVLVSASSITASAVAVRKHASKSDIFATRGGMGQSSQSSQVIKQLVSCLTSLNGGITRAAIDDCANNALGLGYGSSPNTEAFSTTSESVPPTSMMTGQ
jgi:hypothetical protein